MTTHATTSPDKHHHHHQQTLYSNRTYARTTTTTTTTTAHASTDNRPFHPYLKIAPPINVCENLLYDVTVAGDVGSATSSSYINSSEHYDNTYTNTYDNPIQYFEKYPSKSVDIVQRSFNDLPRSTENFYDRAKDDPNDGDCSPATSRSTSPVLFYLENKNLAVCACIISLLLLLLIGLGIFFLNKLIRPVIINTTVNNHYGFLNMTNTTTTVNATALSSRLTTSRPIAMLLKRSSVDMLMTTTTTATMMADEAAAAPIFKMKTLLAENYSSACPPNRWGSQCENLCKPCGLGTCHPTTGECLCPADIYGEFCDLWKVDDKPKRGDMTS